eukprot:TRINITY_DN3485_c0_g1_i1.p1 TRINITY_DN3485_c0_g1~~TRINITY_DN3485_c0_g1_i1.p1  ORF type:complete len:482 (-),score=113.81 TRINITY_DN3485_c0_g1_i1:26-1432(-)
MEAKQDAPRRGTKTILLPRPSSVVLALQATFAFYRGLVYFLFQKGSYTTCDIFEGNTEAKVYVFSLATMFTLWSKPHYRNPTFQIDLMKNLRNVAIPGTGLPLSVFAANKLLMYFFVFVLLPIFAFLGAFTVALKYVLVIVHENNPLLSLLGGFRASIFSSAFWSQVFGVYISNLLMPEDWFNLWQINCRMASYHHFISKSPQYAMENKWEFLRGCQEKGVAGTPVLDIPELVVKDRNEEGGMGIFIYKNALNGGDWIIQPRLRNAPPIQALLPNSAPLSTFRVLTASTAWLDGEEASLEKSIRVLTCVFRAGLSNALTDHKAVMFRLDHNSGEFGKGTSCSHWYELGPFVFLKYLAAAVGDVFTGNAYALKKLVSEHSLVDHPDTGVHIAKEFLDKSLVREMVQVSTFAHYQLVKDVPFVGWDVAITTEGVFLLEANLSCNFFRGTFDRMWYFATLDRFFTEFQRHQ